jgi:hypothetical protein
VRLIYFNSPLDLPWQTNLFDLLMLVIVVSAIVYSIARFRGGQRIYAVLLFAALLYGQVLELAGMATLDMYVQGQFVVMLNYPALPLFAGTTAMPFYVTIFYPVWFFTCFKVVESLGIKKNWQAAITGGLFSIAIDAPYIIEGNLRHIVWWTWDPDFAMFQYFVGWPLADLTWQAVWGALFFYAMLRARRFIDGPGTRSWSNARAFGLFAPLTAVGVIVVGTVALTPLTVITLLGGPQWPLVAALVLGYLAVTAMALRAAEPPAQRIEPIIAWVVGAYVAAFSAMVVANVVHEGRISLYILIQAIGLAVATAIAAFPVLAGRRWSAGPAAVGNADDLGLADLNSAAAPKD